MINRVGLYNCENLNFRANPAPKTSYVASSPLGYSLSTLFSPNKENTGALAPISTKLESKDDVEMYNELISMFATSSNEKTSSQDGILRQNKLDSLLKNGILQNRNSNDNSSVLENIYKAATTERAANMDGTKIAGQIIDALYNPAIITQQFGDIPESARCFIGDKEAAPINIEGSGTCVAASVEFHMANKHQAEFARWAESLTSPKVSVEKNVNLSALSKNTMDALFLLNEFKVNQNVDFNSAKINLKPDENAIVRTQIQDNFWDLGERTVLDVLFQSTLMQLGSQQSYDSLTDIRAGQPNANPKGLIEFEKTFIESIVENSERTSVVYQNVDENQILQGWNCPLETIQKNITDTIDSGEDVIIGYVLTAGECGQKSENQNKIVNGHEITIVDYKKDKNGDLIFVCNDTDDNNPSFVEYKASFLLPKIHHAGFPVEIIEGKN